MAIPEDDLRAVPTTRRVGVRFGGWIAALQQSLVSRVRYAQFAATLSVSFAIFGVQAIQGIVLARMLGPHGRGEYGTAVFYPQLLVFVGLLGSVEVFTRLAARRNGRDLLSLRRSAVRTAWVTGGMTGLLIVVLAIVAIPPSKAYLIPFCLLTAVALPFEHIHLNLIAVDRGSSAFRRFNRNRLLTAASLPLLLILFWAFGWGNLTMACVAFVGTGVVGTLVCLDALIGQGNANARPSSRRVIKHGRPYAWSMAASELFERLDIVLILWLATIETQGHYLAMVPAIYLLTIAPHALGIFLFNLGARKNLRFSRTRAAGIFGGALAFQVMSGALFALVVPWLVWIAYGDAFLPAVPLAIAMIPAGAIKGFVHAVEGFMKGRGRPMVGVWGRLVGTLFMLVTVLFCYGPLGIVSVPLAACVGQLAALGVIGAALLIEINTLNRTKEEAHG